MPIVTKDEFDEELRRDAEKKAERLSKAKAEAASRGKEPFDLAKLETMCDTSTDGRVDPIESRNERFEWMYYVSNPDMMTLKELAELVTHLSRW
jgi:hypothetical protein